MSGHNPHSHLSQPNSSWNPLQIPSYIPRQPQLAHMSNERPLVRSPLTWHTPTPPEALYSFISANHKNLELNPLIPSFVRGPAPFGSMDLTIQSVRNSTTPSPRTLSTPPPEFAHNKSISCNVSQNSLPNSISPSPGVIQTTASIREKYTSNGKNGEFPTTGSLIVRDARQINNELVKLANREQIQDTNQPVELVKESNYQKSYPPPTSPKGMSPSRPPSVPLGNPPASPPPENKGLPITHVNPMIELVNNHITMITPQKPSVDPVTTESSPMCSAVPSPANTTSNEDSVDSSASKTRRKRKPNKTVRVANDSDDSLPSNNEIEPYSVKVFESSSKTTVTQKEIVPVVESNANDLKGNEKNETSTSNESNIENVQPAETPSQVVEQDEKVNIEPTENQVESKPTTELPAHEEEPPATGQSDPLPQTDLTSVIVDNTSNRSDSVKEDKDENTKNEDTDNICAEKSAEQNLLPNCSESPLKETTRKGDSDDIETIDKIAAMIADTNEAEVVSADPTFTSANQKEETEKTDAQNCSSNSNSKLNDLTEILTAPITEDKPSQETTEIAKENCFEEVENKLEEMFAGIEEERPFCVEPPPIPSSAEQASAGVTCELGLELPVGLKNEKEVRKDEPVPQKRSHSTKHDEVPPKKKRKIVKKPLVSQLSGKPKSKSVSKCTTPEKPGKEKIKSESSTDVKYKGPYIQLKPDGSIIVVNTPITEDDNDKQNKVKKTIHSHTISERSKIRGLHVSTLSTKYDADTTDASWMCVFCKKGPHKMGLGDLFGPYFVSTSCEEFQLSQIEPSEDEFISKRSRADMFQKHIHTLPVVPAASAAVNIASGSLSLKKKRKIGESTTVTNSCTNTKELLFGMTKVSETSFEVWAHENCAVWAPGVYLVGARIVGLEAAVWASTRYLCSICSQNGAMVCCLQRGCSQKAHIPCAQTQNWNLNETEFKSFCSKHSTSVS